VAVNFGPTAHDYARYRTDFPPGLFGGLAALGAGLPGQRVVDVGTGTGVLARGFAAAGCTVVGVDVAPELLAEAERHGGAEAAVPWSSATATSRPSPAGSAPPASNWPAPTTRTGPRRAAWPRTRTGGTSWPRPASVTSTTSPSTPWSPSPTRRGGDACAAPAASAPPCRRTGSAPSTPTWPGCSALDSLRNRSRSPTASMRSSPDATPRPLQTIGATRFATRRPPGPCRPRRPPPPGARRRCGRA
jgi:Methyltransferase domain